MPRPGPRRAYLAIRSDPEDLETLVERATNEADGNVSEMTRRLLKYALANMPPRVNGDEALR